MSNNFRSLAFLSCIFAILSILGPVNSHSSKMFSGTIVLFQIDENSRIFWSVDRNLPELLISDSIIRIPETPYINFSGLRSLIHELIPDRRRIAIIIVPHPNSHFMVTDKILKVINLVEMEVNQSRAQLIGLPFDSLPQRDKFKLLHELWRWQDRDTRIMQKAYAANKILIFRQSPTAEENTFIFRYESSYWKNERDSLVLYPLTTAKPGIGIPPPISDDDEIDFGPIELSPRPLKKK